MSATPGRGPARPLSVAPMMDWTDRHYRRFVRGLTRRTLLYSEMITANAVLLGDRERLLGHDAVEHPVALQLGGDDPARLAEAAAVGVAEGGTTRSTSTSAARAIGSSAVASGLA
jgi:tRNA-dihydrouridine synthase A